MKLSLCLVFLCAVFSVQLYGNVNRAFANARAGLEEALRSQFPSEKNSFRTEQRDGGILIYKVSAKRIDGQTVRFRITGYNGTDEVSILTYRIVHDNKYLTVEEFRRLRRTVPRKER